MQTWPLPADPDSAARLIERFAALGPAQARFATERQPMFSAIGGNSPFLSDLAVREQRCLRLMSRIGPGAVVARVLARIDAIPSTIKRAQLAAILREAKRQVALVVALADIGGDWSLAPVTAALSSLAEATLRRSVAHLLRAAHDAGELHLADPDAPERDSGLIVLGMGKLGARELNYSSDIDLILFFDPAAHPYHGDTIAASFTRIARGLISLMEARDADGYVFRTDLRLRPDPAATSPAVSLPAALAYYESMAQNWERAAMIKARPVAGDLTRGRAFLDDIRPFIWRRGLDFAAMADIQDMKRRIDTHRKDRGLLGRDLKLAPGGIREVEFAAQTLQLVWGGRNPALREPTTLGALDALVAAGRLPAGSARDLVAAYHVLRRVEHRLQMVADRQTHRLPESTIELDRFARFMGEPDAARFSAMLTPHMARVADHYAALFAEVPNAPGLPGLDLRGPDAAPPEAVAALHALGFRNLPGMIATLRGWRAGRIRALRSERARALLDLVQPALLAALARQTEPDAAFARFDALLGRLPAGVQVLSLFHRNPALLDRVAGVLGAAPSLADYLATSPAALEGLLSPEPGDHPAESLSLQLVDARGLEEALAITRRTVRGAEFRLCAAQMEGWVDVDQAGLERTALADSALTALLPRVVATVAERHGQVPGGAIAVVALGKAGGREMMAGSDLDLMFIYDHPPGAESDAPRPMAAGQWFIRAAHAYVAALTARGAEGSLYEVDMRLRPSGNKGPVAVSLSGFERYHAEEAWTWERMALTRARVVAGPATLCAAVERAIATALGRDVPAAQVRADAAAMRVRLLHDLPPRGVWDVKLRPGGQIEVEFIAQVLGLIHGARGLTTRDLLAELTTLGALTETDHNRLVLADRLWRSVQSLLRIAVGRRVDTMTASALELLRTRIDGAIDLEPGGLCAMLDGMAAHVRRLFTQHVGAVE